MTRTNGQLMALKKTALILGILAALASPLVAFAVMRERVDTNCKRLDKIETIQADMLAGQARIEAKLDLLLKK